MLFVVVVLRFTLLAFKFGSQQVSYFVMADPAYVMFNKVIFLDILTGTLWLPLCVRWWTRDDDALVAETVVVFFGVLLAVAIAFCLVVVAGRSSYGDGFSIWIMAGAFTTYIAARLINTLNLTTHQIGGGFVRAYGSNIAVLAVELAVLLGVYATLRHPLGLTDRLIFPAVPMLFLALIATGRRISPTVFKDFSLRAFIDRMLDDRDKVFYFAVAALLIQSDRMIADYVIDQADGILADYLLTFAMGSAVYGVSLSLVEFARTRIVEARENRRTGDTARLPLVGVGVVYLASIALGPLLLNAVMHRAGTEFFLDPTLWTLVNLGFLCHSLCSYWEIHYMLNWRLGGIATAGLVLVLAKLGLLMWLDSGVMTLAIVHLAVGVARLGVFLLMRPRHASGLAPT